MPSHGPSARPRPGGGFNPGSDGFGEHLDEDAVQQAMSQKQLGQQQAAGTGSPQGVPTGTNPISPTAPPPPPREVGSIAEELITRPLKDIGKGLLSLFDFSSALGLTPPESKSPEEKARVQATHRRYQKLNQEQQAYARQKYQEEMQKKKMLQEEGERQRAQKRQMESQSVVVPSSPKNGPVGPSGSGKQRAATKLEQDRKTLGGPQSAN
ncbi:hypothetical protein KA012_03055 [Candidatus Woesebacteria bacterium]|nr:hypothetical protein [Candidatus Woesebacteria bacterium]